MNNVCFFLCGRGARLSDSVPSLSGGNSGKYGKLVGWAVYLMGTERKLKV